MDEGVSELLKLVRAGDEGAVADLLQFCEGALLKAVRGRLNQRLRGKFDSQDFVQAVWMSFFAHLSVIDRFEKRGDVVKFVVRVATNKVVDETRRRMISQKRNINRERPLEGFEHCGANLLKSKDPSPSELVAAKERWDLVLGKQPEHYRSIFNLRVAGRSVQQIAREMDVTERTVSRVLARIATEFANIDS